ncbi:MAG: hypothetical protein N2445_00685 [Acidobacteria bacterium]|nr:hypothetical protein [Acidobacteriota bacterium]
MKKIFQVIFIFTLLFALALQRDEYWRNVKIIEKNIYDKHNLYSASKEELSKLCEKENKKALNAFNAISTYFDKAEKIILLSKESYEKEFSFSKSAQDSPFNCSDFKKWQDERKGFFVKIYSIFKSERDLSLIELAQPSLKIEFFRETKGNRLRCAMFPYGYSYKCGKEEDYGKIMFAPSLGYCFSQEERENSLKYARLEFFGSQEYITELSSIRPLRYSENYICFRFDEKGNIL